MIMERQERHGTVREGYQILLRADAELLLPQGKPEIRSFYKTLVQTCMTWAKEVYGERLRKEFLSLEDVRDRARFHTQHYRFRMRSPWESAEHLVMLCESEILGKGDPRNAYHRISHVWNIEEELMLPLVQILQVFDVKLTRDMLPFRPDGIYPQGDGLVFFRNATQTSAFLEKTFTLGTKKQC